MAYTTFETTGKWQGQCKSGYQTATKVAGLPAPASGFIWRRKRFISDRWRWGQGITLGDSRAGERVYGDDLGIVNGPDDTGVGLGGEPDYMVIANDCIPSPPGSGIWRETMVAEGFSDWEQWELVVAT